MSLDLSLGTLLVAPPSEDADPTFGRTVVMIVDREPAWTITGLVLNRPTENVALDEAARAALFLPDFTAPAYWGGPVGHDPVVLAEITDQDGLEWFHLDQAQRRPFPVPGVGLVALGEHHEPFERRIGRARLYVGLTVWAAVMLEREIEAGEWWLTRGTAEDIFAPDPDGLLTRARARARRPERRGPAGLSRPLDDL
ncbi:MAG: YqgE/AlgH family protein [Chloroflexi bacterium]|nr:YqgE/AlgH family protein [Chloroflexota bacterium]